MHEARITRRWLRDQCQSAADPLSPGFLFWWVRKPQRVSAPAFGRYLANRSRDVKLSPHTRAWDEATWIVEVVVPDDFDPGPAFDGDPGAMADALAAAVDARLNPGGRPRVNAPGPYGGLIVSCERTNAIDYLEPRADDADRIHRGGMYRIRTRGPEGGS